MYLMDSLLNKSDRIVLFGLVLIFLLLVLGEAGCISVYDQFPLLSAIRCSNKFTIFMDLLVKRHLLFAGVGGFYLETNSWDI